MLKTHPDFKSLDAEVQNADTMDDYVGEALSYSYMFEKRTTPWEAQHWDYDALQKFEIDVEKVDRLYYIYHTDHAGGQDFKMIARMEYEEAPLYVELDAGCDYTGFECQGNGVIYVSRDANLFMKLVLSKEDSLNRNLIYKSLREDRIYVEEDNDYDNYSNMFGTNVPMLKYLCHEAIYENKDELCEYKFQLPNILVNSIDDFIRTKEAKIAYNQY